MKKILTPIALMIITGSLNAASDAEIYHGFAKGNPDLETHSGYSMTRMAEQPGIGSGRRVMRSRGTSHNPVYQGFESDNPDLYSGLSGHAVATIPGIGSSSQARRGSRVLDHEIYHGFEKDNPDL
ncbi:MAG: hypothetical protein QNJ78_11270 [Gammaproteobacteria bacterium]|nr:hypothetical protein [Gammaproteobacteria bacterium]